LRAEWRPRSEIRNEADGRERRELLRRVGKHKRAKGWLYLRKLADVDAKVLEQLVVGSVAERKRRHA